MVHKQKQQGLQYLTLPVITALCTRTALKIWMATTGNLYGWIQTEFLNIMAKFILPVQAHK